MLLDYDIVKTIYINFKLPVFNPQNPFFQCKKDYQIRRESEMIKFQSIYLFSVFIELGHINKCWFFIINCEIIFCLNVTMNHFERHGH